MLINNTNTSKESLLNQFFIDFYEHMVKVNEENKHTLGTSNVNYSKTSTYQDKVFEVLHQFKKKPIDPNNVIIELEKLQSEIESMTTQFDDIKNVFQLAPDLLDRLISRGMESAKHYILKKDLDDNLIELLHSMEHYTLEGIIVHVLGLLYNCINDNPAVRVSTLVEYLSRFAINHAIMTKDRHLNSKSMLKPIVSYNINTSKNDEYLLGTYLVEFIVSRELITLSNNLDLSDLYVYKNNKGKYYLPKNLYAVCNFDIGLLPVKLNLPMVCRPVAWNVRSNINQPKSISDLSGGYMNVPVGDLYLHRYRLLSSRDYEHFNIYIGKDYSKLCNVMNRLQDQAFEINTVFLDYINHNYDKLVEKGLLMPKCIANVNIAIAIDYLRDYYFNNLKSYGKYSFQDVYLKEFMKRVQRARYEDFILKLASAYSGYQFYLPAFLDFRGRIYRAGVLHFHERDLARSLIVYSKDPMVNKLDINIVILNKVNMILYAAAGFHYKKFSNYDEAFVWTQKNILSLDDDSIFNKALEAKEPFQFLCKSLLINTYYGHELRYQIPITQDASASAYQIMSYFLLDEQLAKSTNLIPSEPTQDIKDIYTYVLEKLQESLSQDPNNRIYNIIRRGLTRKLVKLLFMPMIYGKSLLSMGNDLHDHYSAYLSRSECVKIAKIIKDFFKDTFPEIVNLMNLVQAVSWIASFFNKPLYYDTPLLTTMQDYLKSDEVSFTVYDRKLKKRRKVLMRVPTTKRDRRKTVNATFANFIHQKDANIAASMILELLNTSIPIYSVHDNFITSALYVKFISNTYTKIFTSGQDPLYYINHFMVKNLGIDYSSINLHDEISTKDISLGLDILQDNIEKNKDFKLFSKHRKTLLSAYACYVKSVCYHKNGKDNVYDNKWKNFKEQMSKWENEKYNYSLHL